MRIIFTLGTLVLAFRLPAAAAPTYVGSAACRTCHAEIYARWQKTPMANIVRDPKDHPEAILPDLTKADPLLTFKKEDIALVYGSIWKQRYFTRIGNDYYPEPVTWDVTHQVFRRYFVENNTDWWTKFYPPDNMKRPTGALCDGCHSVNYNIQTKTVTEWNVGCERCHGPGSDHAARPARDTIVNPARLNSYAANDVCIQCHSQGQPIQKPLNGVYYDWPVGFEAGKNLRDFWQLEEHKLGE
ncbi:MAG TPA: multiheme c-type cytochrome, partial [Bryobacteraceae bacterium]|nr:multiheme c-type cytochrome [Bryobacteraceae bacterium]